MASKTGSLLLTLLLLQLSYASPTLRQSSTALTLDPCRSADECAESAEGLPYRCLSVNRGTLGEFCAPHLPTCRCFPTAELTRCTADSDCIDGEICANYTPGTAGPLGVLKDTFGFAAGFEVDSPFCVSANEEKSLSDIALVSSSSSPPTGSDVVLDNKTPFSTNGGLMFDPCTSDHNCVDTYQERSTSCWSFTSGHIREACIKEFPTCRCVSEFQKCESDNDCIVGEVCGVYTPGVDGPLDELTEVFSGPINEPFCVSTEAEKSFTDIERYPLASPPATPTGEGSVVDFVNPVDGTGGLTLDKCASDEDCLQGTTTGLGDMVCLTFEEGNLGSFCFEEEDTSCRCMRSSFDLVRFCNDNSFCLVGEGCAKFTGERGTLLTQVDFDFTKPFCISVSAVDDFDDIELIATPAPAPTRPSTTAPGTGSEDGELDADSDSSGDEGGSEPGTDSGGDDSAEGDTEDAVCVDSRLISHLPVSKLAFARHVLTKVLCDRNDSCATRGHMVVYQGAAMRMSAYCELVWCREQRLHVNSPRYERGMRIRTKTQGLEFTAFAARFDTKAEEIVLSGAVRIGL